MKKVSNLYTINQQLLDCIDLETGEIIDIEKFDSLQIDKNEKLENIALWYKNLLSESEALKAEKDKFADREKRAKSKAESLKKYLDFALHGNKFGTVRVDISYRKSKSLDYDGITEVPVEYLKAVDPTIDKAGITKAIKDGETINGFKLVDNNNIQIK